MIKPFWTALRMPSLLVGFAAGRAALVVTVWRLSFFAYFRPRFAERFFAMSEAVPSE